MTTQFRSHNGEWRVASTEQFTAGQHVQVSRRSGNPTEVIIVARVAHDPARELPYLYSFQDVRAASGAQTETRVASVDRAADLLAMFDRAALAESRPTTPAVRFALQTTQRGLRLEMAGTTSRYVGELLALSQERTSAGRRPMYGRLNRDGVYTATVGRTSVELEIYEEVLRTLRDFAANPAEYAAAHGRATGNCCFCGRGLTDERSVAVGYGPICADYYGLPWGDVPAPPFEVTQGESQSQRERQRRNRIAVEPADLPDYEADEGGHYVNAQGQIINRTLHGIATATGEALDAWGRQYNVPRTDINGATFESDADYRRAIRERMQQLANVPTIEDIQNEPSAMRRMAMAAQRHSAGLPNMQRDGQGRLVTPPLEGIRQPAREQVTRTMMGNYIDPRRDESHMTGTPRQQVTRTVRRIRPAVQLTPAPGNPYPAPAPAPAPAQAERRASALERLRAAAAARRTATPPPRDETVSVVQRVQRRDPNTALEEDDFVWPPRNV
jgi:hypothetical protein